MIYGGRKQNLSSRKARIQPEIELNDATVLFLRIQNIFIVLHLYAADLRRAFAAAFNAGRCAVEKSMVALPSHRTLCITQTVSETLR